MQKNTKPGSPVKGKDGPAMLQRGNGKIVTLKEGENHTLLIVNPNEAQISCTVIAGDGQISLYKNKRWIGNSYYLSIEDEKYPTTIRFNTNSTLPHDVSEKEITVEKGESVRKLARQYGVREESIRIKKTKSGKKKLTIPASLWELYIEAWGADKNAFKVKLLPKKD